MKKWFYLRLASVGYFALSGLPFGMHVSHTGMPVFAPAFPFVFFACSTVGYLRAMIRQHPHDRDWSRPTWFSRPLGGPAHGFHVASFSLMALGVGAGVPCLYHHGDMVIPLFFFAAGLGVYCGLLVFYRHLHDQPPAA